MVTRTRLRALVTALGLYTVVALLIGYFGVNAYTGAHGLKAKQDIAQQLSDLTRDLGEARAERRRWEQKVQLLRDESIDPDLLDERARAKLGFTHPRDLTLVIRPR